MLCDTKHTDEGVNELDENTQDPSAKEPKKETTALASAKAMAGADFMDAVKQEYVKKYAQDVVRMIEDQRKLKKAYDLVTQTLEAVERGEYEQIEKYKKLRNRLETEDDFEI